VASPSNTAPEASGGTLRLILGDQLDPQHSWFARVEAGVVYVLMEVRQETDHVLHHAQKILAIFAAMREFARELVAAGHRVCYLSLDDPDNLHSITGNLQALMQRFGAARVQWPEADEWRVQRQLEQWARRHGGAVQSVASEHFLSTRGEVAAFFGDREHWVMEGFYRAMRRRHRVLLDARGQPEGQRWNFDHDNRKPWRGVPAAAPDWRPRHDHAALWAMVRRCGVGSFGDPAAQALCWPLNRAEALAGLEAFVAGALPHFGSYEDAMSSRSERLFHSLLSFALNTKMLRPLEVARRVEAAYRSGEAPLAAAEGFIRQIIGWREYIRGVYWAQMPGYERVNALRHELPLPNWFWTGEVRMRCLRLAIGQSLRTAHAHHIQRLMVIGNFALLAGIAPHALHRWYLGVYIDAFEWVELPNTVGMSQWADGGRVATKPYVSSAAYLQRMSDYCAGCPYDPRQRLGQRACPFNALYWDFFARHRARFEGNARLRVVYLQLDRFAASEIDAVRERAAEVRARIETL
jgi:deoxyribodipyrimidine photolyase-related protein